MKARFRPSTLAHAAPPAPSLRGACGLAIVTVLAAWAASAEAQGPIVLRDVTGQTGIRFRHTDGSSGRRYIVETMSSGLATFDYDGDGRIDVYFLNGRPLPGAAPDPTARNALYRNLGDFRFEEVTEQAGVGGAAHGMGVCVGDYDNDGHPDLYLNNFGPNQLLRNNGDGTFIDVTPQAGVARGDTLGAGANFLDIDGDGQLDLFVSNYVRFTYDRHVVHRVRGVPRYAGPRDYPHQSNNLYRNNGDGTFSDRTAASGIGAHPGPGMGTVCADYDGDGATDVFVCNDTTTGNFLFHNDGRGRFTEVGLMAGVGFALYGEAVSAMGVDCADYDNDGRLDLFVTDYQGELPALFRNLGHGTFEDVTLFAGAGVGGLNNVKWGCGLVDFDNDGFRDIFYVCGHVDDNIERTDGTTSHRAAPVLLRNLGNGKFANVSNLAGDGMKVRCVGRGVAFDDLDNDGRVDVVVLGLRGPAVVLRNESPTQNHWVQLQLRGVKTNRDGVGARVRVVAGDLVQTDEVHSGRGYQSHFGSRLHFGLGKRERVDRVEVYWIGGGCDVYTNLPVDGLSSLVEGGRRVAGAPSKAGR